MIDFQITLSDADTKQFLVNARRKLDETEKPLAAAMMYMVGSIKRNFLMQGRPMTWKPLSVMTIAMRKKGRGHRKGNLILRDTDTLMSSISPGEIGSITKSGKTEAQVGTALEYASLMQYGGTSTIPAHKETVKSHKRTITMAWGRTIAPKKIKVKPFERQMPARSFNVPARPFLLFQIPEDIDRIHRFFDQHVDKAIEK